MAAPSRSHHHATPLLSVYSAPISESTTIHATHSLEEKLRHVNERISERSSDSRVDHGRLYHNRESEPGGPKHFTVPDKNERRYRASIMTRVPQQKRCSKSEKQSSRRKTFPAAPKKSTTEFDRARRPTGQALNSKEPSLKAIRTSPNALKGLNNRRL